MLSHIITHDDSTTLFLSWYSQLAIDLQAIEAFQRDPPTTVFLLSMRSGSVGINLTSANYVFILEPALNPALEEQAIGRAWRMGQQREVTVKKFYVKVRTDCQHVHS